MDPQIVTMILRVIGDAMPKLVELFSTIGGRDAFLAMLDAALVGARAKNDADLRAKHADDTRRTPVPR